MSSSKLSRQALRRPYSGSSLRSVTAAIASRFHCKKCQSRNTATKTLANIIISRANRIDARRATDPRTFLRPLPGREFRTTTVLLESFLRLRFLPPEYASV
ncbi:hypothetical protein EMEDMD4_730031 [Sinorhizobium medicae]|uniref:Uncharacterized protein n=1 Tax=Sinorhizobium medicae TaxID=110321 RepID=A0A508X502_9HYPH|nr:hypothetical protein EMEDMD4_730031 [Sinorhizobium medicae]